MTLVSARLPRFWSPPEATMELDHVIVFVAGPEDVASVFPGFVLDQGMRHTGQGTRNRRVLFPRNYVEILWIDDSDQARRSGLGFAPRCAPDAPCPFGVVLRGTVGEPDRKRYVPYQVPAGGPALLLLAAALHDPSRPFVAVRETRGAPRALEIPQQPSGAVAVRSALLRSPTLPDLGATTPRDVRFEAGGARLVLEWDGPVTGMRRSSILSPRGAGVERAP
jgi:Glyoxalase-like domain